MKTLSNRLFSLVSALLILSLSAGFAWAMNEGAHRLPLRQYFSANYTNAVWDWSNPTTRDASDLKDLSDFLYLHQLNAVYVDVSLYAEIAKISDPAKRADRQKDLEDSIQNYVKAMNKRGVRVYAAAGNTDWSKPSQRHIPAGILQFAQEYNQHHPAAKLAGVQFDIESYNQKGFAEASYTEKGLVLTEYLEMVDTLATQQSDYIAHTGDQLELGFAAPYWFDNENGNIRSITWHGKTGPAFYHLADRLGELPKANIVVMAYRNAAAGSDGTIAHSRTEVEYVQAKAPHVKVMIGQEVSQTEPAKITFYGQTPTELSSEVRAIYDELGHTGALGGVAINDLSSYQQMQINE
jgi:hypothetical protein